MHILIIFLFYFNFNCCNGNRCYSATADDILIAMPLWGQNNDLFRILILLSNEHHIWQNVISRYCSTFKFLLDHCRLIHDEIHSLLMNESRINSRMCCDRASKSCVERLTLELAYHPCIPTDISETPIAIFDLGEQLLNIVNIIPLEKATSEYPLSSPSIWSSVHIYTIHSKPEAGPGRFRMTILDDAHRLGIPPVAIWEVQGMRYSPPLQAVGHSKTHAAALSHFLLRSEKSFAIVLEERFDNMSVLMNSITTADTYLYQMIIEIEQDRSWDIVEIRSKGNEEGKERSGRGRGGGKLTVGYLVRREFVRHTLLLNVLEGASLLEAHMGRDPDVLTKYSWRRYWTPLATAAGSRWKVLDLDLKSDLELDVGLINYRTCGGETIGTSASCTSLDVSYSHSSLSQSKQMQTPSSTIPKNILMVAMGKKYIADIDWITLKFTLLSMNPGYTFHLYTDSDIDHFLRTVYPQYLQVFYSIRLIQWRSDLVRYLLLYEYGGVYIDVDLKPVLGFDEMLRRCGANITQMFVKSSEQANELCNGFIITPAKDPLFLTLAEAVPGDCTGRVDSMVDRVHYGVNVKRFYSTVTTRLFEGQTAPPPDYHCVGSTYFLRELNMGYTDMFGPENDVVSHYVMRLDNQTVALYSNGKLNWPPSSNVSAMLYLSS